MLCILLLFFLSLGFLLFTEYRKSMRKFHLFFKTLTSAGFLAMAVFLWVQHRETLPVAYALPLCIALLFCLFGDFMLSVKTGTAQSLWFVLGVAFFMLAHGVFFLAFGALSPITWVEILRALLVALVTSMLAKFPCLDMGDKKPLLYIYSLFLGLLLSKGVSLVDSLGVSQLTVQTLIACCLFYLSDIILLFILFMDKKVKCLPFINLSTYYLATLLLAMTLSHVA